MTHQGLRELFGDQVEVETHEVTASLHPIWALGWIISRWSQDLPETPREEFLELKVRDLIQNPEDLLGAPYVASLSTEAQFELAAGTMLLGRKAAVESNPGLLGTLWATARGWMGR